MPVTRSMESERRTTPAQVDGAAAAATVTPAAAAPAVATPETSTAETSTTTNTTATATTGETTATGETTTGKTAATHRTASPQKEASRRPPSAPRTTSTIKRRALAKAREFLLQKEVELAAARVAALEADSEDEIEADEDLATRNERTTDWVNRSTLALTMEPYVPKPDVPGPDHRRTDEEEVIAAPPPQTCSDALHRGHSEVTRHAEQQVPVPVREDIEPARYCEERRPQREFDYNQLATAITLAARAVQPAIAPRTVELPCFHGSSNEWLPFKAAYDEAASHLSEQERLSKLRHSLKGAARDATLCLFVGSTTSEEVMKMLAARFGRPDALAMTELNKLRALPRLAENPRDICIFASKVLNVTATVKALKKHHYLHNAEVVRSVIEKLPPALRYRYYDFAAEQPEDHPDLLTLSKFLEVTADRCGSYAPAELTAVEDRREPAVRKGLRAYHTQDQKSTAVQLKCQVCKKEGHHPYDCNVFKKADQFARWELARTHRLCFRCLRVRKFRHNCKPKQCEVDGCKYTHHPLLHDTKRKENEVENSTAIVTSTRENFTAAYLKILPVQVTGPKGTYDTYALLDDGSTCTLIESAVANKIGVHGPPAPFYIEGVAGARITADTSERVHFTIQGRNSVKHDVSARTMDKLMLTTQGVPRSVVKHCRHLEDIEDQLIYEEGHPTVLLGQDNWSLLLTHDVRRGTTAQPVASLTDLGWVLHGATGNKKKQQVHRVSHLTTVTLTEEQTMDDLMKEHFALESLGVQPKHSHTNDELNALRTLEEKTRRLPAGGFETGLLFKQSDFVPPDNYNTAMRRLELVEKKLDKNVELKRRYETQMNTLIQSGYAEKAPAVKSDRTWYLPHFAVINPQKPEKLRIVHDAAARTRGISLNDMLLSGPDLIQSLPGVLMRFRQRPVAVAADIKDMFLRINIREEDRDMQRFLWREDRRIGPPTEYRMRSVIFGATSSPCTAIYIKNKNAEEFKEQFPEAAQAVIANHYVDDYLASFDTEEVAIQVSTQVANIHKRANYHLQRWASNSNKVRAEFSTTPKGNLVQLDAEKILGMVWDPNEDNLGFNINQHKLPPSILEGTKTPTKREALRTVMSLFDPLGLVTPVTIQAKKILQDTWRTGIDWDVKLQDSEAESWSYWLSHVRRLPSLAIPRCYPGVSTAHTNEIHTFVDASSSQYACAVYWRAQDACGNIHVSLIAAKGKVAPLNKVTSIPRLELQSAVLGCRLARTAIDEHDIKPTRRVYWSDSRTVLSWLRTGPRAYKPFVAHRIAEIAEETKTSEWRWVPTKENVADDATRDTPHDFNSQHRWFHGPAFLRESEANWPREVNEPDHMGLTGEERVNFVRNTTSLKEALPDATRFSSWLKLVRTTARVLQFIELLRIKKQLCNAAYKRNKKNEVDDATWTKIKKAAKGKNKKISATCESENSCFIQLETHHLHRAQQLWIRSVQDDAFSEDVAALKCKKQLPANSRLSQLSVIIDSDDVIRLRSRIAAAVDITDEQKAPPIMDGKHTYVQLYISWVHRRLHHGGFETTTNEVRQHLWVLRLRNTVRSVLKRCQQCRIRRAVPAQPSTGDHPRSRLAHHQRPFTYTGLDYFGPMTVTVGRAHQKRYGVLFTCLTTRAVHLEVAGTLSTDSAVMALRRFIGRRGCPTELWSDQGTNLKGADVELRRAAEEAMKEESSVRFIQWRYIPPSAPFMGGAWERLVRSVKTALAATLHERAPKEEVLTTLLIEVEHTLNSRPLTHVSTEADDDDALTPNHFLMGGPSRVPLPGSFTDADATGRREWRASQQLANHFWSRWVKEYLPELQHRRDPRASHGAIRVNDLVLIADGTLPRNLWPRGVVVATYPGPDGETRAVDVRTNKGVLRRPTKKLVILPTATVDGANTKNISS